MAPVGGVMIGTNRMDAILEIDLPNRCATVQPGVINLSLTRAVASSGYFFAPDPSSQMVSSIGGNVATNAGGPHCLKYGITTNHVLGLEMVTGPASWSAWAARGPSGRVTTSWARPWAQRGRSAS